MEKKRQQQLDDNFIEQKMAEAFGYSDEQLAEELDRIAREAQGSIPQPPEGEFEKILERVEAGKNQSSNGKGGHKGVRVRRLVKVLVAAALLGAMVLGSGMWTVARRTKEYQERSRTDLDNVVVFNSSDDIIGASSEIEEAYEQIEKLGIQVLELSYLPEEMSFYKLRMQKRSGIIEFVKGNDSIFLYQGLNNNTSSLSYVSDMEEVQKVYNSYLEKEISVYQKILENGNIEFSTRIMHENQYVILQGVIDEESFVQIIRGIKLYKD